MLGLLGTQEYEDDIGMFKYPLYSANILSVWGD